MSAYVTKLVRQAEQAAAHHGATRSSLRMRLEAWHLSLPSVARNRPFAMAEFEAALGTAGRLLSATLIEAGWARKRRWHGTEHYYRYWVPPLT